MTRDEKDTSWKVMVREFKQGSIVQTKDAQLTIPQKNLCTQMPGCTKPLGRPIDANMAVRFIYNFIHDYKTIYSHHEFENFDDMLNSLGKDELKRLVISGRNFTEMVADLNCAMSLDKNMALKILSQPGCEGLRFYLCERPKDIDENNIQNADDNQNEISLVVVGFDSTGHDLNYWQSKAVTYKEGTPRNTIVPGQQGSKAITNIEMKSLNVEYVTPPYGIVFNDIISSGEKQTNGDVPTEKDQVSDCFVLLNMALNQHPIA
jgi:hypothetical protein